MPETLIMKNKKGKGQVEGGQHCCMVPLQLDLAVIEPLGKALIVTIKCGITSNRI